MLVLMQTALNRLENKCKEHDLFLVKSNKSTDEEWCGTIWRGQPDKGRKYSLSDGMGDFVISKNGKVCVTPEDLAILLDVLE